MTMVVTVGITIGETSVQDELIVAQYRETIVPNSADDDVEDLNALVVHKVGLMSEQAKEAIASQIGQVNDYIAKMDDD